MRTRFFLTALLAILLPALAGAQGKVSIPPVGTGFKTTHLTSYDPGNYQGMDCYKDYVLSCNHTGIANLWILEGGKPRKISRFNLASQGDANHANVVSFGVERFDRKDPMPLVYVSQCHKIPWNGLKDVLFVERIRPDLQSSELVQVIRYDDVNKDFGYALQWVIDRRHKMLYGFGNTTGDRDIEGNRHRIIKFRLPKLSAGKEVVLRPEDALENYVVEDHGLRYATIGQGLCIHKGKLMMPTGVGNVEYPSWLFVWDLRKQRPVTVLDMGGGHTTGELEDFAHYRKNLYLIQAQTGLYLMEYPEK